MYNLISTWKHNGLIYEAFIKKEPEGYRVIITHDANNGMPIGKAPVYKNKKQAMEALVIKAFNIGKNQ